MTSHDCRRCKWHPDPEGGFGPARVQLAEHAAGTGHPLCIVCAGSLEPVEIQSCAQCVAEVRRGLAEVVELYALLPSTLGHPPGQRLDSDRGGSGEATLPGGDALVMLAGGSAAHLGDPGDPPAVAFELGTWEDDWRSIRGEAAAPYEATVVGAAHYLGARLSWAGSHHPAFDELASDLRRIVSRLRTVTAMEDRPVRGVPCLSCGATLERHYADRRRSRGCVGHWDRCPYPYRPHGCTDSGGLEDVWRCPRCRRTYPDQEYRRAVAQQHALARSGLVPAVTIEATMGIRQDRLRQWAARGKVARRGQDERGRTLYATEEVREYAGSVGCLL